LDMARAFRTQEQCRGRDVIRVTEAAQSLPCKHFAVQLFDRTAARGGPLRQKLMRAVGVVAPGSLLTASPKARPHMRIIQFRPKKLPNLIEVVTDLALLDTKCTLVSLLALSLSQPVQSALGGRCSCDDPAVLTSGPRQMIGASNRLLCRLWN
jgi:hypothetical protein